MAKVTESKKKQDFVIMPIQAVWSGAATFPNLKPGWVLGDFFPVDDPRYTTDFEIKEWNAKLVQHDWKKHAEIGTEYISVKSGTLLIMFGGSDETPIETTKINLRADHAIAIKSGVWRRYAATDDASGLSVRRKKL